VNRPIKPVASLCFKISHREESLGVWAAMERSYPGLAISWICGGGLADAKHGAGRPDAGGGPARERLPLGLWGSKIT